MGFDPFKLASWWAGMAIGIPMLAAELAAEVWQTEPPKPAPVPAGPDAGDWVGMSDRDFRARFPDTSLFDVATLRAELLRDLPPPRWQSDPGMHREVAEIRTRFSTDGIDEVVKAAKRARKKKGS